MKLLNPLSIRSATVSLICLPASLFLAGCDSPGGSRHERHAAQIENTTKVATVSGGESFQAALAYDKAYEAVLTFLKKRDCIIDTSNKETGQIVTAHEITGGWRQTGTRNIVTLIKESDSATTVKVTVTEQHRFKAFQIEPWEDPQVNGEKSGALAKDIKGALELSAGTAQAK